MRKHFLIALTVACGLLTACGTSTEIEKTGTTDTTCSVVEETIQEEDILVEDIITEDVDQQPDEEDFDRHTCTNEELLNHVFTEEEMLEILIEGAN